MTFLFNNIYFLNKLSCCLSQSSNVPDVVYTVLTTIKHHWFWNLSLWELVMNTSSESQKIALQHNLTKSNNILLRVDISFLSWANDTLIRLVCKINIFLRSVQKKKKKKHLSKASWMPCVMRWPHRPVFHVSHSILSPLEKLMSADDVFWLRRANGKFYFNIGTIICIYLKVLNN